MLDFVKKIFRSKEPETVIIESATIPSLIRERKAAARSTLLNTTAEPIRNIRNASAQLRHIVNTIAKAEHEPEIHPKLKSIAKNTLPQFIKSMKAALTKELPEEPEEFYTAAVESVKNCLNSVRGPGRYLQIVFPDEIKAARKGIDAMGTEINSITRALALYRSETTLLDDSDSRYREIASIIADIGKCSEKLLRIAKRCGEIRDRIAAIEKERVALMADPIMREADRLQSGLADHQKHHDDSARIYASLSMTASHVLRKAEKIAVRQKHPAEISVIQDAMSLLSDHEIPDVERLKAALIAAFPAASRMIESGDIPLKNKEERAMFADIDTFCRQIPDACRELIHATGQYNTAQDVVAKHPAIIRAASLEREHAQLALMLEKELQSQKELEEWLQKEKCRIPVMKEELRKKMGEIIGKNVQFQDEQSEVV